MRFGRRNETGVLWGSERGKGGGRGEKEEEKEGKVDSLCPSCHGIAIPELPGVLPLREQLFTR
jgi:hypothetical protein